MTVKDSISAILNPQNVDGKGFLAQLGLDGIPSSEQLRLELEDELLKPKSNLISQWMDQYQIHWDQSLDVKDLFALEPSSSPLRLSYKRAGLDGRVVGAMETRVSKTLSALNSTSMQRAAAAPGSFVRGKSGHVPFWPGGLDEALGLDEDAINRSGLGGLQTIPPGFTRGLRLPGEVDDAELMENVENHAIISDSKLYETEVLATRPPPERSEIDEFLPPVRVQLSSTIPKSQKRSLPQKRDWAHVVDINKPMSQARFKQLVPEMAHNYPFELDTFQKEAVYHLEQGDSVFVAAHTSAGKTVVAEYAIALAAKHMTRAIYTSPIKALSNQKFRDFKTTFSASSVGILTGDVQINPEANCLIMTTEILRSMLYKGADLIRDVEFVIFDEVHYVNDAERGVVWEEVIIMLPDHVNIILLSATVPNTKEFADWVGRTKKKDIYVISTPKRPVPLEHFLYAGKETFKIVDAKGAFLSTGYKEAGEALRRKQDKEREAAGLPPVQRLGARAAAPQRGQRGGGPGRGAPARGGVVRTGPMGGARTFHSADKNLYVHLLTHLRKKDLLPVVVFTFSKKRCEENAATLTNADLCNSIEKSEVHVAVEKALSRLKGTDKLLPQIGRMRDLLSRGIGVHHGGLLPIVKEVVEILFARGLVKILFATETFAMGVNMPARSVVFSGIRKHDGKSFRELLAGEYTQMSGRAGRRGLDSTGVVVIVAGDELPEMATLNKMMLGVPSRLQSQFRLTYNMILNLLRVEALKVEEMIKRSFSENASQKLLPDQQKKIAEIEDRLKKLPTLQCDVCSPDIQIVYDLSKDIVWRHQDLLTTAAGQPAGSKLFVPGRVVILRDSHFPGNIAVLLRKASFTSVAQTGGQKVPSYFVLALVDPETKHEAHEMESIPPIWNIKPSALLREERTYDVCVVPISSILRLTNRVIKPDIDMILERQRISTMLEVVEQLQEIIVEWNNASPPQIPEVEWSKMRQLEFQENLRHREALEKRLDGKGCTLCEHFGKHYDQIHERTRLLEEIGNLKYALSDQNLELLPDYEQRIAVLKDLKFIDENSTVQLKGRVACEINSADELILTELVLENTFANYELEEVAALLSCFVFQEKTEIEPVLTPALAKGREEILVVAERVSRIQDYHKVSAEDFEKKLKFGLVEVVYEWAKGTTFEDITKLTDVAEGTIVRVITRLDETFREVRDAARVIGDAELFKKMEEAQTKIKRDIVFAASLYF